MVQRMRSSAEANNHHNKTVLPENPAKNTQITKKSNNAI